MIKDNSSEDSILMRINDFFQEKSCSAISLLTDEDEHIWFGLEFMNHKNEKAIFGFVKYDQGYLLGDID